MVDKRWHPAKDWPSRWIFDDWSKEPVDMQVLDLLHDIRLLLFIIMWVLVGSALY